MRVQTAPKHHEAFGGLGELTLGCVLFNISGTCTSVILLGGAQTEFHRLHCGYVYVRRVSH